MIFKQSIRVPLVPPVHRLENRIALAILISVFLLILYVTTGGF